MKAAPDDSIQNISVLAPFKAPAFDFFAQIGAAGLHACGVMATERLLEWLDPKETDEILEVGCGTGHTLAVIHSRYGSRLTGIEANPSMLDMCQKRLRFCGADGRIRLVEADYTQALPFHDERFDKIYCESVLAFQPRNKLVAGLKEIYRVLKPGGRFVANETLWLPTTASEDINAWNEQCEASFGLIQAEPRLKGPNSLKMVLSETGFEAGSFRALDLSACGGDPVSVVHRIECLSKVFTRWKAFQSRLHPALLWQRYRLRRIQGQMNQGPALMQGWLLSVGKQEK